MNVSKSRLPFFQPVTLSSAARKWITYALVIFMTGYFLPGFFFVMPGRGLDPSWGIAIHLAWKYHLIFGKDLIFTYGPLAVVSERYPICLPKYFLLLADLYFMFVALCAMKAFVKKNLQPGPIVFILICFLVGQRMLRDEWCYFFFLLFLFSFIREPARMGHLAQAFFLALFGFYFKANSGLVELFIVLAAIHYVLAMKKLTVKTYVVTILAYLFFLLVTARLFHTDLTGYIHAGFQIVKDYGEAMDIPLDPGNFAVASWSVALIVLFLLAGWVVLMIKWIGRKELLADTDTILIYAITWLSTYVWFKSGFVRADYNHIMHFFHMIGLLALLLYIYTPRELGRKATALFCWLILCIAGVAADIIQHNRTPGTPYVEHINRAADIVHYFCEYAAYDEAMAKCNAAAARPNPYKAIIGQQSADVFPSEISLILYNGLRYDPRFMIQSYQAYNQYFDSIDHEKYLSPGAPDYILFSYQGIDGRCAWTDEARTKLAMIDRYQPVKDIGGELLLKKSAARGFLESADTMLVRMGQDIPVKKSEGFELTQFLVDYNWKGRIQNFFYQPPKLKISFTLDDGEVKSFRGIRPVLADGIILNKFAGDMQEFQLLLLSDGRMNTDVTSFRIDPADSGAGFRPEIKMITTRYIPHRKDILQQRADSLAIAHLVNDYRPASPVPQTPAVADLEGLSFSIDNFTDHANFVRISGWAYRKSDCNTNNTIKVLARSEKDSILYEMPCYNVASNTLGDAFQRGDIDSSGFIGIMDKSQLPPR